eukprot:1553421-Pleurochrysis_carterae.AAC.5
MPRLPHSWSGLHFGAVRRTHRDGDSRVLTDAAHVAGRRRMYTPETLPRQFLLPVPGKKVRIAATLCASVAMRVRYDTGMALVLKVQCGISRSAVTLLSLVFAILKNADLAAQRF